VGPWRRVSSQQVLRGFAADRRIADQKEAKQSSFTPLGKTSYGRGKIATSAETVNPKFYNWAGLRKPANETRSHWVFVRFNGEKPLVRVKKVLGGGPSVDSGMVVNILSEREGETNQIHQKKLIRGGSTCRATREGEGWSLDD